MCYINHIMNKIPTQPLYSLHGNTGISGSFKRDLDYTSFFIFFIVNHTLCEALDWSFRFLFFNTVGWERFEPAWYRWKGARRERRTSDSLQWLFVLFISMEIRYLVLIPES